MAEKNALVIGSISEKTREELLAVKGMNAAAADAVLKAGK